MNDLKDRIEVFASKASKMIAILPKKRATEVIGRQILRSTEAMASYFSSVDNAGSKEKAIFWMEASEDQCATSIFWMKLLSDSGLAGDVGMRKLKGEAEEIQQEILASVKTIKKNDSGF